MNFRSPREFLIDWGGVLVIVIIMVVLTNYIADRIITGNVANEIGRSKMETKVSEALAGHSEIKNNQRIIINRLERIEARLDCPSKGKPHE